MTARVIGWSYVKRTPIDIVESGIESVLSSTSRVSLWLEVVVFKAVSREGSWRMSRCETARTVVMVRKQLKVNVKR